MNEQQAQEMIHYLSTLANFAMLMNDKLEQLLEIAEVNATEPALRSATNASDTRETEGRKDQ